MKITISTEKKSGGQKWGFFQTAFWGYSVVGIFAAIFALIFDPFAISSPSNPISTLVSLLPIAAFFILVTIYRKNYIWSFSKKILYTYTLLFYLLISSGFLYPSSPSSYTPTTLWGSYTAALLLIPIFIFHLQLGQEKIGGI